MNRARKEENYYAGEQKQDRDYYPREGGTNIVPSSAGRIIGYKQAVSLLGKRRDKKCGNGCLLLGNEQRIFEDMTAVTCIIDHEWYVGVNLSLIRRSLRDWRYGS